MSNHDLAVKNGLIADPKSACKKCHNENGHTPVWYNYEENWSKINHARIKVDTNQGQKQPGTAVDGKQVPTTIEMMKTQELDLPVAKPLQTKIDKPGVKRGKK